MFEYYVISRTRPEMVNWALTHSIPLYKVCHVDCNERLLGVELRADQLIYLSYNHRVDWAVAQSRIRKPQSVPQFREQMCLLVGGPKDGEKHLINVYCEYWKVIECPELETLYVDGGRIAVHDQFCTAHLYRRERLHSNPDEYILYLYEPIPSKHLLSKLLQGYRGSGPDHTKFDPDYPC